MRVLSLPLSILLHAGLVAVFLAVGLSSRAPDNLYVPPVPIDVISEAEFAELISVPEMTKAEEPVQEEPSAENVEPIVEPRTETQPPAIDPDPVEPDPEPKTEPEGVEPEVTEDPVPPKTEPPKPDPEPTPPAPEEDELDLGDLGEALGEVNLDPDKQSNAPKVVNPGAASGDRNQEQIGAGDKLSITEEVLLQACVQQKYSLDRNARDWENFVVDISVQLNIDGSLARPVRITNQGAINRSGNAAYQAAARNAQAAITSCFPLDGLDPARYSSWDSFTYQFDPKDY